MRSTTVKPTRCCWRHGSNGAPRKTLLVWVRRRDEQDVVVDHTAIYVVNAHKIMRTRGTRVERL